MAPRARAGRIVAAQDDRRRAALNSIVSAKGPNCDDFAREQQRSDRLRSRRSAWLPCLDHVVTGPPAGSQRAFFACVDFACSITQTFEGDEAPAASGHRRSP